MNATYNAYTKAINEDINTLVSNFYTLKPYHSWEGRLKSNIRDNSMEYRRRMTQIAEYSRRYPAHFPHFRTATAWIEHKKAELKNKHLQHRLKELYKRYQTAPFFFFAGLTSAPDEAIAYTNVGIQSIPNLTSQLLQCSHLSYSWTWIDKNIKI